MLVRDKKLFRKRSTISPGNSHRRMHVEMMNEQQFNRAQQTIDKNLITITIDKNNIKTETVEKLVITENTNKQIIK